VSEKDKGQADALSKGFAMCSGDIIGWINSDDYYQPDIFKQIVEQFSDPEVKWLVGNLTQVFEGTNTVIAAKSPTITYANLLQNPDIVRQQSTFFRRQILEEVGLWNSGFYMVMDFDLWVRLSKISAPKMLDCNLAYFRFHEAQKTSHGNILRQCGEIVQILEREKAEKKYIFNLKRKKYWEWFKGLIKANLPFN
jgi:cellulose synthase/poly-beta-1,6-N-acetylglucosamine synthase-like glycosyltransferase